MTPADTTVALLAGGLATRLRPITETIPKAMVEVAGKPFVDHQLELLARSGFQSVVLCLGYRGEQVEAHVGDGSRFGMSIFHSYDGEKLLGTAGALKKAAPLLSDPFLVLYGDSYLPIDYAELLRALGPDHLGVMSVFENEGQWDTSNVVFRDGRLLRYDKRTRTADMTHIDYGAIVLRKAVLDRIPDGTAFDLSDLLTELVAERTLGGFEVFERFYEIGSPAGLAETDAFLRGGAAGNA